GRRILSEKAVAEMESDQVGKAKINPNEFVERARGNKHNGIYGLGMWREELNETGIATLISSPSWAGTYPWIDKRTSIRGVIMAHVDTGSESLKRDKFSGFWSSPVIATMVRSQLAAAPSDKP
ncbi:MAG: serine hydrolase, partial [Luteolibacter sp.]